MTSGCELCMVRGDHHSFKVTISGREFVPGDLVTMTVRRGANGGIIFEKTARPEGGTEAFINVDPADTKCMPPGEYVYDLQFAWEGRTIQTAIPCSKFVLECEVTR